MKPIEIEALLGWAFREELPKAETDGTGKGGGADWRELGTLIDLSNRWDVVPDFSGGEPHPDAIVIGRAVKALDGLAVDLDGVDLLGDPALADLDAAERAAAHADGLARATAPGGLLRSSLAAITVAAVTLRRAPPAPAIDGFTRRTVTRSGKPAWFRIVERSEGEGRAPMPVEVDGYDHRRQRPHPGAYRKYELDPALGPVVAERVDYQAWRVGLDLLVEDLAGRLERWQPTRSAAPRWPWEGEAAAPAARVLRPILRKPILRNPDAA
ncbi:hypothetical protein NPA31_007240 [Aurantimonas sp. MSK8Z-1]|uniref:hypothetical protein n=1 Tax=Mangrovibrevibacter kandeliae TaxID=2968473 RepID=UPI002118CA2F|nr:hypothetical protein [Aurantimonas sp. MSK8Z-1]MCW4114756.1 hypothetical protein [Aurantimonas sp. MSK8Z-1]